jgi:RNA polymerase sigma-70 factor (ECF subfamily)
MATPSDDELARRARRGEVQAFGELVQRYQSSVFNVCYRLLGERQEAEDLAQEAFLRAFQRFDLYDIRLPFGPWVRKVAANLCLNRLQVSRAEWLPLDDERGEHMPAKTGSPETIQAQGEQAEAVRQALSSLPAHYRAVVELRHFQELSYAEIARMLAIPLSDVKSHLFRARRLLAEKLKSYG